MYDPPLASMLPEDMNLMPLGPRLLPAPGGMHLVAQYSVLVPVLVVLVLY